MATTPKGVWGIAVDALGNAYVTGYTEFAGVSRLPRGPFRTPPDGDWGGNNGFVTKLNAGGSALLLFQLLGRKQLGLALQGIALDASNKNNVHCRHHPFLRFPHNAGCLPTH